MSHVRTQIRAAVAAGITSLGNVTTSRVYPAKESALPAYQVSTGNETVEGQTQWLDRTLDVIVDCVARADDLDSALDTCIAAVETLLGEQTLGGLAVHLVLTGIEITQSGEGSAPIGRARLTYQAMYRTAFSNPATSI